MTEFERMEKGLIYDATADEITSVQNRCLKYMNAYNSLPTLDVQELERLSKLMFASFGEGSFIQPPFYANWGGFHTYIGKNVYANFSLTLVDDGNIYIDDYVMIGPNVTIATAGHPVLPSLRKTGMQFNADVHIASNVWIGAGAVLLPGVTIGKNSVIGAGSIVTKDIPENVVAAGNPCRVLREIGQKDREYYFRDRIIDLPTD